MGQWNIFKNHTNTAAGMRGYLHYSFEQLSQPASSSLSRIAALCKQAMAYTFRNSDLFKESWLDSVEKALHAESSQRMHHLANWDAPFGNTSTHVNKSQSATRMGREAATSTQIDTAHYSPAQTPRYHSGYQGDGRVRALYHCKPSLDCQPVHLLLLAQDQ